MRISDWSSDVCSSDLNARIRDSSRGYVMRAIEGSLRRLGTDWLDVYMIHWPDYGPPIDETLRAPDDLVREDRKSVGEGKSVSERVDHGGRRISKNKPHK